MSPASSDLPIVAIIGRPNVGKSALFNRLLKRRHALMDATPGVTRDRQYGDLSWKGKGFRLVDTGGLQFSKKDRLGAAVQSQVAQAMREADLALLVVDVRSGLLPLDSQIAAWVRQWGKPLLLVANKAEEADQLQEIHEFSRLGLGEAIAISALHNRRVEGLLNQLVSGLKRTKKRKKTDSFTVAIVGRPNVGKSSLLNRILGQERVIVSEDPGTTRDPIEEAFTFKNKSYRLIDTAGVRARRKLKSGLDVITRLRSLQVLERADICLFILDGVQGLLKDDLKLLAEVVEAGRPLCLLVNKWDLMGPKADPKQVIQSLHQRAPFIAFASVTCTSAKTGKNVLGALEAMAETVERSQDRIAPNRLRQVLRELTGESRAPVAVRSAKFFNLTQVGTPPPVTFHLLVRIKRSLRQGDLAFLERGLRKGLNLIGVPLKLRILRR